ncbi:MAG: methionine--tRNA ligase subunit beta [Planctomycetota bacterium]|nr:methionine--tRNA ligase subunit beta [Planctomycetota bacterium]
MSDAPTPAPSEPQAPTISFDDFAKLDLRVAKVLEAHDHPNADRLIVLKIDLGTEQRQLVAGLRGHYEPADLVGRLIVVVKNLAPRRMRGEESQGMLLAASDDDKNRVILLSPERDIAPGAAVS